MGAKTRFIGARYAYIVVDREIFLSIKGNSGRPIVGKSSKGFPVARDRVVERKMRPKEQKQIIDFDTVRQRSDTVTARIATGPEPDERVGPLVEEEEFGLLKKRTRGEVEKGVYIIFRGYVADSVAVYVAGHGDM